MLSFYRVPFQRGKDLAKQYKVEPYLRALFNYEIPKGETDTTTPTKEMVQAAQKARDGPKIKKSSASPRVSQASNGNDILLPNPVVPNSIHHP
jgi:regulatory protein SWI6